METTLEQKRAGERILNELVSKAQNDKVFRNDLIANPYQALENVGCPKDNLPKDFKIRFEDQTDNSIIYLNIPRKVNPDTLELSDEQLEMVAGGEFFISFGIGVGIGVAAIGVGYVASHIHVSWK